MTEIRRMWEGGPLRQFSAIPVRLNSWNQYHSDSSHGYAGSYVCDDCQGAVVGVYRILSGAKWVCAACETGLRGEKERI